MILNLQSAVICWKRIDISIVYIDPSTDMVTKLQDELLELIKSASTFESVQIHKIDELHLSLTRTVILQHHWIDEFVQSVEQSVKNSSR